MNEMFIDFALPELYGAALSQLKVACRFDPAKEPHARMLADALAAHREWADGVRLAAVAACFAPAAPQGHLLRAEGISLVCPAFAQIDARDVTGFVAYALSLDAGEAPALSLSRLFYRDLWENAYLEAALAALRARCAARTGGVLSDAFGPGCYGMRMEEMKKIARVLDFGKIGAAVLDDGTIRPPKSCAGIFLAVREAARMPADACRSCAGDRAGCSLCVHRSRGLRRQ